MIEKKVRAVGVSHNFILDSTQDEFKNANILLIGSDSPIPSEMFDEDPLVKLEETDPVEFLTDAGLFNKALRTNKIKLIICVNSAALMACAMAGGGLIQKVNGHNIQGLHRIKGAKGEFLVPSSHSQMMYLSDMDPKSYEILMWSLSKSDEYVGRNISKVKDANFKEPEYVLFKNFPKPVLAIMPDVNKMRLNTRTVRMTNQLINKYLNE